MNKFGRPDRRNARSANIWNMPCLPAEQTEKQWQMVCCRQVRQPDMFSGPFAEKMDPALQAHDPKPNALAIIALLATGLIAAIPVSVYCCKEN